MRFEWDKAKALANLEKHGVSFEEAKEVFLDNFALDEYDTHHSDTEDRFIRIGLSRQNVLLVIYAVRDEVTETYRLISARKASKEYETAYWKERNKQRG